MSKRIAAALAASAAAAASAATLTVLPAQAATASPAHTAAQTRPAAYGEASYIVVPGDTLSGIAARNGLPLATVEASNPQIANPNLIYPGQQVSLSGAIAVTPQAAIIPATSASTSSGASGFQECVIQHESGGDPTAVNPTSGAGGLYQFLPSTFAALGYSGLPENAPVWEQNQAFWKLYAEQGTAPWAPYDGC